MNPAGTVVAGETGRVTRHGMAARIFHWLTAVSVLTLLATGLAPVAGVHFSWVTPHWVAGVVLAVAVVFHIGHALLPRRRTLMWIGSRDVRSALASARAVMTLAEVPPAAAAKYTFSQKAFHHLAGLVLVTTILTGALMMIAIDTPFWSASPYFMSEWARGVVFVLHGLAAMLSVTLVITHIYMALRPEAAWMLRSMLVGWITREEYRLNFDDRGWRPQDAPRTTGDAADALP